MPQELFLDRKFAFLKKMRVGVVRGGNSAERRISLRSGRAVTRALKSVGIHAFPLDPADRKNFWRKAQKAGILFIALHGMGGEDGSFQKTLERKKILFTGSPSGA